MSAIIYEGGKPRIMPETDTIYTDTVDGGICEWKPASSMEIGPAKITKNGEFTADDFNYYGLSEVEIDVQEEVGDYIVSVDEDGKPHIETDDWDLTIDDYGFPELGDLDIGEALDNLDFDTDIDISFDDMNLNIDTLDTDFELNLDTLELTETELPDEIRIMHVPDKTSYKDGEEIDLDGLVVQAYRGGEVWNDASGKYVDGYVPVHELRQDVSTAEKGKANYISGSSFSVSLSYTFTQDKLDEEGFHTGEREDITVEFHGNYQAPEGVYAILLDETLGKHDSFMLLNGIAYSRQRGQAVQISINYNRTNMSSKPGGYNGPITLDTYTTIDGVQWWYKNFAGYDAGHYAGAPYHQQFKQVNSFSTDAIKLLNYDRTFPHVREVDEELIRKYISGGNQYSNAVTLSWPRPKDNKLLTASFDITVEESEGGE